ncbi:MAG: ABC transporter substrate-binding protein [Butyricicoccaceae bacterium]
MKKRILALLAAGTMLLTGCGAQNAAQSDAANSGSDDLQHLTVVLDWYPNALHAFLYEAQEKGYFAEEGLDVDIQSPAGVNDAMSMVAAGKADIGLYYQQDVIQARAEQDVPIKSIGAVVQGPLNIILSLMTRHHQAAGSRGQNDRLRGHRAFRGTGPQHHAVQRCRSEQREHG